MNDPAEVDGLPAGAVCEVWETREQRGHPDATEQDPAVVTIEAGTIAQPYTPVTVTNDYPTGRAELVKLVKGDAQQEFTAGPYQVIVNCWAADRSQARRTLRRLPGDRRTVPEPTDRAPTFRRHDLLVPGA